MPKVSICVPNYNYGDYIGDTIQSILDQTYSDFELIVVDDASTDNSMEVINSFNDKRLKVHENKHNLGITANWNKCLEYVAGDYIAIFHSDDIYHREIIEHEVAILSSEKVHIVGTRAVTVLNLLPNKIELEYSVYLPQEFLEFLFTGNTLVCPSVMMKKEVYDCMGAYRADLLFVEDQEFYLRAATEYGFAKIENLLMVYRQQVAKSFHTAFNNDVAMRKQLITEYGVLAATAQDIWLAYPNQKEITNYYLNYMAKQNYDGGRSCYMLNMFKEAAQSFALAYRIVSQIKGKILPIAADTI